MMRLRQLRRISWTLLSETIAEWQKDKVSTLSAALAYYTIFSLAPLLVFVIAIAGFFFGQETVQDEILLQLQQSLGNDGAKIVQTTLENVQTTGTNSGVLASILSLVLLFIGATGVFAQLQDSLNTIWSVKPLARNGWIQLLRSRLLSFSMVIGIGFLLLVSLILNTVLSAITHFSQGIPDIALIWQLANIILSYGVTSLLFAMIFKFLPNAHIYWRDVWIGAIVTTLLFSVGKSLLGLYISRSGFSSTYGAAGSLVILIAWIYYSAQILFIGAEFTQVYARHYGSKIQSVGSVAK